MNLKEYRQLVPGYARNHHFSIGFTDSAFSSTAMKEIVSALAFSTVTPIANTESVPIQVQYGMPKINIVGNLTYSPWTVTFYCDEARLIRKAMLKWQNKAVGFYEDDVSYRNYSEASKYKAKAFVGLLNNDNSSLDTMIYKMVGIFPQEVGPITLNQQDTSVTTFDVQFVYDYFEFVNTKTANNNDEINSIVQALTSKADLKAVGNSFLGLVNQQFNKDTAMIQKIGGDAKQALAQAIPAPIIKGQIGGNIGFDALFSGIAGIFGKTGIGGAGSIIKRG